MIKQKALEFIIIQMVKFKKEILKKINGNGIYYYECGDKYEGNWKNGKREGNGICYYGNGDVYNGEWKNSKKKWERNYYL